jgi:hypothetical protein
MKTGDETGVRNYTWQIGDVFACTMGGGIDGIRGSKRDIPLLMGSCMYAWLINSTTGLS